MRCERATGRRDSLLCNFHLLCRMRVGHPRRAARHVCKCCTALSYINNHVSRLARGPTTCVSASRLGDMCSTALCDRAFHRTPHRVRQVHGAPRLARTPAVCGVVCACFRPTGSGRPVGRLVCGDRVSAHPTHVSCGSWAPDPRRVCDDWPPRGSAPCVPLTGHRRPRRHRPWWGAAHE